MGFNPSLKSIVTLILVISVNTIILHYQKLWLIYSLSESDTDTNWRFLILNQMVTLYYAIELVHIAQTYTWIHTPYCLHRTGIRVPSPFLKSISLQCR